MAYRNKGTKALHGAETPDGAMTLDSLPERQTGMLLLVNVNSRGSIPTCFSTGLMKLRNRVRVSILEVNNRD
jgi:hypothetical protein